MAHRNLNPDCRRRHLDGLALLVLWMPVLAGISLTVGGCPTRRLSDGNSSAGRTDGDRPASQEQAQPAREHPAFAERVQQRDQMVAWQIESRRVSDPNVLRAMRTVPRHAFVPVEQQPYAYSDYPLPIGHSQTISQPYVVAFMTEALKLTSESVVLEIGTGSGYQAAVAAEIAKEVYSIEIVEPLAKSAAQLLSDLGYANVHVKAGDGYYGWPEEGPFDAIIGTAAAGRIPPPLIEQLKTGGRMILPVTGRFGLQSLILLTKDQQGTLHEAELMPVRFVPMTGDIERAKKAND